MVEKAIQSHPDPALVCSENFMSVERSERSSFDVANPFALGVKRTPVRINDGQRAHLDKIEEVSESEIYAGEKQPPLSLANGDHRHPRDMELNNNGLVSNGNLTTEDEVKEDLADPVDNERESIQNDHESTRKLSNGFEGETSSNEESIPATNGNASTPLEASPDDEASDTVDGEVSFRQAARERQVSPAGIRRHSLPLWVLKGSSQLREVSKLPLSCNR